MSAPTLAARWLAPALAAAAALLAPLPAAAQTPDGFHPGDQVALVVEGEEELSATFTVGAGPVLVLPGIGEVPMAGVRRADVQEHLRAHLSRYLRDPVVRAHALIRLTVTGQVGAPGFYTLPGDAPVSDVVMAAGGPLAAARLTEARIFRGDDQLWRPGPLRDAIAAGMTIDQMGLRAGDRIDVPAATSRTGSLLRAAAVVPAAIVAVVGLVQLL